jgi:O-antigen ligase
MIGKKHLKEVMRNIIMILIFIILYEGSIVLFQTITLRPLGIFYENNPFIPQTSDDSSLMRPVGFRSHPNELAVIYTEYFFVLLYYGTTVIQKNFLNKILIATIAAVFTIAISRCRSAYLAISTSMIFFFYKEREFLFIIYNHIKKLLFTKKIFKIITICCIAIMLYAVIPRIYLFPNTFFDTGAYYGRQKLIDIAFSMIRQNIYFGVGTKMFIPAALKYFPDKDILLSFPEEVHNGFLLILSENGILSFICFFSMYILYIYLLQQKILISSLKKFIIMVSLISSCIIMLLLPYKSIIPLPILFLLVEYYGHYEETHQT